MLTHFPKYFTTRAISLYISLLLIIPLVFGHPMYWYWWLFGIIEVCGFFYFSNWFTRAWDKTADKLYEKKLFWTSWIIRTVYVLVSFCLYNILTGTSFEIYAADSLMYDSVAREGSGMIWTGTFDPTKLLWGLDISDRGYPFYLSVVYALTGNSVIISRIIKASLSAYSVLLIYRLAKRNFGVENARIAAVFCMLMPNLVYYCGLQLKETEMLFLTILFIERADALFRSKSPRIIDVLFLFSVGTAAFFFRAVLAYILFMTLIAAAVFGSKKLKKAGKWIIEGCLLITLGAFGYLNIGSGAIETDEYRNLTEQQSTNMQWRAQRANGNSYAKYASASIFAPLIFTIPFPTMVNIEHQQNQQMIHGGNYVKNITSFFTILALVLLLLSGEWRDNIVPLAFMIGYLIVIAFSNFAQSERFHIPSLPFELMFASYAVTHFKAKHKNWFSVWVILIFIANICWAWFKLRGRGM